MEMAYRLILYILIANVGYMIFSLASKGFKHYSGYISELFFLLSLMIVFIAKGFTGIWAILISLGGIGFLVILPMILQQQIDALIAEGKIGEIEPLAGWKANIAWSELNVHMHTIAKVLAAHNGNVNSSTNELRKMIGQGDPYDEMTNSFINLLYFNERNFSGLIDNIITLDKSFDEYSFDALLYLVRAFLETTRYDEALKAQIALERQYAEGEKEEHKLANLQISRMIFFAFTGWVEDFDRLIEEKHEALEQLPSILREFWKGVVTFNSGKYALGESIMAKVISDCSDQDEEGENPWIPFMRQRFHGLVEHKDFFEKSVLPHLQELKKFGSAKMSAVASEVIQTEPDLVVKDKVTNILAWLTLIVSISIMMSRDIADVVNLIDMGANSSFLVLQGQYYRLFNYQFIHMGWLHLFMNVMALKYFGPPVETILGWPAFIALYLISGVCGGIATVYWGQTFSVGASAAVLGLLSATIVFELLKVKGVKTFAKNNNFTTLIFILVVNIIIGLVEPIIDNSAHVGGLMGGAVVGLIFSLLLRWHLPRKLISICSILFILAVVGFSGWQNYQFSGIGQYPVAQQKYKSISNASETISLSVPVSWNISTSKETQSVQKINVVGPFHEQLIVTMAYNNVDTKEFLNDFVDRKTTALTSEKGIEIKSRKGPDIYTGRKDTTYELCWALDASGQDMFEKDYLIFSGRLFCFVQFFAGTKFSESYEGIMSQIVNSIRPGKIWHNTNSEK